jgi:hypothetical protein
MTRIEANRELLKILSEQVEQYPCMRFVQLLCAIDLLQYEPYPVEAILTGGEEETLMLRDSFYEESTKTLKRVKTNDFIRRTNGDDGVKGKKE